MLGERSQRIPGEQYHLEPCSDCKHQTGMGKMRAPTLEFLEPFVGPSCSTSLKLYMGSSTLDFILERGMLSGYIDELIDVG